jgi:hypothetical protein
MFGARGCASAAVDSRGPPVDRALIVRGAARDSEAKGFGRPKPP